jgi:hypothetical protein
MDPIEEQILEVAKAFVVERSWPWIEPIEVRLTPTPSGERAWSVRTNMHVRGRSVRLLIRESDFSVIDFGYLPR